MTTIQPGNASIAATPVSIAQDLLPSTAPIAWGRGIYGWMVSVRSIARMGFGMTYLRIPAILVTYLVRNALEDHFSNANHALMDIF